MDDHEALIQRIRARAYELSQRGDAGTPQDNWMLAEQQIREQDSARGQEIEAAREAAAAALEVARRTALTHP